MSIIYRIEGYLATYDASTMTSETSEFRFTERRSLTRSIAVFLIPVEAIIQIKY